MRRAPFTPPYKARRLQRERAVAPKTHLTLHFNAEPLTLALDRVIARIESAQRAAVRNAL